MNYLINEKSKDLLNANLLEATILIAAIPERMLDAEMRSRVEAALQSLQQSSRVLDNLRPEPTDSLINDWNDMEGDVQP
jgi:FKBP-type peptidyl-prolyl cis-trans isomerase (trigger factor)